MDDEYINRVLSGDTTAFGYFLTTYKDMAFNVALSIVKDDDYAEEIVQDSFMKAYGGLKSFKRSAKFKTWFYRIVVNESFQKLRKLKKHVSTTSIDFIESEQKEKLCNNPIQNSIDVQAPLKRLSANESLALNLFYLEENSLKELCDITGWTMANAKVILHRARNRMRLNFEGEK